MPELQAAVDQFNEAHPDSARLVTVVVHDSGGKAGAVARMNGITAPVLTDPAHRLRDRMGVKEVPWTFVLDTKGQAIASMVGAHAQDAFVAALAK